MTPEIYITVGLVVVGLGLCVNVATAIWNDDGDTILDLVVGVPLSFVAGCVWPLTLLIALLWLIVQGARAARRAAEERRVEAAKTPSYRYRLLASQQRELATTYRRLGEPDLADGAERLVQQYSEMARMEETTENR